MIFNGNLRLNKLWGGMDVRTYGNSPLCPTGHQPFGAAAQKAREEEKDKGAKREKSERRRKGGNVREMVAFTVRQMFWAGYKGIIVTFG